jgi:hypothetical protein
MPDLRSVHYSAKRIGGGTIARLQLEASLGVILHQQCPRAFRVVHADICRSAVQNALMGACEDIALGFFPNAVSGESEESNLRDGPCVVRRHRCIFTNGNEQALLERERLLTLLS